MTARAANGKSRSNFKTKTTRMGICADCVGVCCQTGENVTLITSQEFCPASVGRGLLENETRDVLPMVDGD